MGKHPHEVFVELVLQLQNDFETFQGFAGYFLFSVLSRYLLWRHHGCRAGFNWVVFLPHSFNFLNDVVSFFLEQTNGLFLILYQLTGFLNFLPEPLVFCQNGLVLFLERGEFVFEEVALFFFLFVPLGFFFFLTVSAEFEVLFLWLEMG